MSTGSGVDEESEVPVPVPVRVRWRRRRRAAWTLLALIAVALAGLWLARKPLATRYADRFLAANGVPARYQIADLGLGRQRLVNVVLGNPRDPDLVADWLEARTAVGLSGPYLTGVRGGHVRVRARWADGRLSLGSLDRLLPKGDAGKPFSLPALTLDVDDLRARVETPWGVVAAKLTGAGALDGGFVGRLAVTSRQVEAGCTAIRPQGVFGVRTAGATPFRSASLRIEGSAESAGLACAGATGGYAQLSGTGELAFGERLTWTVATDVTAQNLRHLQASAASVAGRVALDNRAGRIAGDVRLSAQRVAGAGAGAGLAARQMQLAGAIRQPRASGNVFDYDGTLGWTGGRLPVAAYRGYATAADGTPGGPIVRRIVAAVVAAGGDVDGELGLVAGLGERATVAINRATVSSASGARVALDEGGTVAWAAGQGFAGNGTLRMAGGGLPEATVRVTRTSAGALSGTATLAPYVADNARLALTPVRFAWGSASWRATTQATLSGPLPGGRVEGLILPVDVRSDGGRIAFGRGCVPVAWQRLAVSGLTLDPATLRLCGGGGALVTVAGDRVTGAATLAATRLTGRLGNTPLTLNAAGARLRLAGQSFSFEDVVAQLGAPARQSILRAASLDGTLANGGVTGRFAGAGGQIGAVPLLLSGAAGGWRFAGGRLAVEGAMTVSDARAAQPRFKPLPVRGVLLSLSGNRIDVTGEVHAPAGPAGGRTVATVSLSHDLSRGTGGALFEVPGLIFDKALQPDQLTPVTFGVVADVRGTVTGEGRIDWSPAAVTSSGTFATDGTDLAAAFGPVQGIAGSIAFTDLLTLESAPNQRFAVRSVNPGIPVTDGVVTFQTLANARVQVEGARWPFAGGTLTLDPSLLDFGQEARRRLTFRVRGAAADQFLQQFEFENLDATGTFDGVLPMVFDAQGGRIENGRLTVREGGGTIAYVGEITQKDVGFWGNIAFQALKSLRYRSLGIVMNGPLAGEMVTQVRFTGVSQGEGAKRGGIFGLLVGRLQRLPFVFNIRIEAPFRGLLDATASFYDPRRLIQRNLPQLIEEQNRRAAPPVSTPRPATPAKPVQPPASETVP